MFRFVTLHLMLESHGGKKMFRSKEANGDRKRTKVPLKRSDSLMQFGTNVRHSSNEKVLIHVDIIAVLKHKIN